MKRRIGYHVIVGFAAKPSGLKLPPIGRYIGCHGLEGSGHPIRGCVLAGERSEIGIDLNTGRL
jgi:hypothetical protein